MLGTDLGIAADVETPAEINVRPRDQLPDQVWSPASIAGLPTVTLAPNSHLPQVVKRVWLTTDTQRCELLPAVLVSTRDSGTLSIMACNRTEKE